MIKEIHKANVNATVGLLLTAVVIRKESATEIKTPCNLNANLD